MDRTAFLLRKICELRRDLEDIMRGLSIDRFVEAARKGRVYYRCKSCGNVGWMSYSRWRRNKTCTLCGSSDIERLTPGEFAAHLMERERSKFEAMMRFLNMCKCVVPILARIYSDLSVGYSQLVFNDFSKIELVERDALRIYFHSFGRRELELINALCLAASRSGFRKVKIHVNARKCSLSKDEMARLGFSLRYGVLYEKTVEL